MAALPTFAIAVIMDLGFVVRGTNLATGWPFRAILGAAIFYVCLVGLMLFSTRNSGKP